MCPTLSTSGDYFRALSDSQYIYLIHSSGCLILDPAFNEKYEFYLDGINDGYVTEELSFLYLGTSSGSFTFSKLESYDSISGAGLVGQYVAYPDIKSNYINSVHGNNYYIALGTSSGVAIISENTIFNSLNSLNILKVVVMGAGCYYTTSNAFYFRQFPLIQNWEPTYSFSGNTNPIFSGSILDFDANESGLIGIKTNNDMLIIKENIITPSASQAFNMSFLGSGYSNLYFSAPSFFNGSNLYGSVILFGSSGIRSIDLSTSGILDIISYPELIQNNVVNLIFI